MEQEFDDQGFAHETITIEPDDTPIQILKLAKEVCDYYDSPGMNAALFESKLYRLAGKVAKELENRANH